MEKLILVKEQLNKAGLSWNGKAWIGALPLDKIERLKQLCRHYDLQYTIKGDGFQESRLARGSRPLPSSKLRPSWEKESFNGKLKRLWILKVCGTDNADPRIEVSSILRRRVLESPTPRLHNYGSRLFSWRGS